MTPQPPPTERPAGLEFKTAALLSPTVAPRRRGRAADTIETVIAPTGVDVGGHTFAPGALGRAFKRRFVKGTLGPSWTRQTALVDAAVELPPGDPRLPATLPDGSPWPAAAGGMWCRILFFAETADGRTAFNAANTTPPPPWRLGFKSLAEHRGPDGSRVFDDLDVFQIWPAGLGEGLSASAVNALTVKALGIEGLEFKVTAPGGRRLGGRRAAAAALGAAAANGDVVVRCETCGSPAALVPGGMPANRVLICPGCVEAVTIDDLTDPAPTAEQDYDEALGNEQPWHFDAAVGNLVPGDYPGGVGWRP